MIIIFFLCRIFLASAGTNENPENQMDTEESFKKEQLKKDLGKRMSGSHVSCGIHTAESCLLCPGGGGGPPMCNGQCRWEYMYNKCVDRVYSTEEPKPAAAPAAPAAPYGSPPKGAYVQQLHPQNPFDIKGDDVDEGGDVTKACRYDDPAWSGCDPFELNQYRTLRLVSGGRQCEEAKNMTRKCTPYELPAVLEYMDKKGNDEDFIPRAMGWISSATEISAGSTKSMDKKGNDEDFIPWVMGWISSATGIGAGSTKSMDKKGNDEDFFPWAR